MLRDDNVIFHFTGPMGVRVEVGQSLLMLVAVLTLLAGGDIVSGLIFSGLLVLSIFLHELGHAWGALVQGVPVRRIMLHGGGGFCERARSASAREDELIVAMGPIVNLTLWALASLAQWWMISGDPFIPSTLTVQIYYYLGVLAFLNLALFIFNMIPVQPLDGGKLFHLILLRFLPPGAAHRITGQVGLVLSVLWIPAMIAAYVQYGWLLLFIPSIPMHYRMARGELA
ncbi:site-2 protease family protein [Yoonia sp. 2307UL14-13]|uniref:site-2 protease family protein n=1 Tax=Yoonia sp. 2307UL14-13 TaxID=3126506 RepID=UPI0030A1FF08